MTPEERDRVGSRIGEMGAETVLLQVPEGLKRKVRDIADEIRSLGVEVLIDGDSCFGACDPASTSNRAAGVDLVVHMGHTSMGVDSLPTVHLPLESGSDIEPAVLRAAARLGDEVGVITTAQHLEKLGEITRVLEGRGVNAKVADQGYRNTAPGQVLGCDLGNARTGTDDLVYVGTGLFHPIGAAVATGKRVLAADPSTDEVRDVAEEAERLIRRRYAAAAGAMDADTWGVLLGLKAGQRRASVARNCFEKLRDAGREADIVTVDTVTPEAVRALGVEGCVNTACPRISLEDGGTFDVPVLTPPELHIALGLEEEYRMDEFGH